MKKIAVILSGCGVYDGSEIHEAVFTLLAIRQAGAEYHCFAPDKPQMHVVDHTTGEETGETRNVLKESARIARGEIQPLSALNVSDFNGLVIPGGFGAAKNLNQWAINGPEGAIDVEVKNAIVDAVQQQVPVCGLCMGPTVIAKALEGSGIHAHLTVGTTDEASPYEIAGISEGMNTVGAVAEMKSIREVLVDTEHRIVTAPCYMMEADITQIYDNVQQAVKAMLAL